MVQETILRLVDDLDGGEAVETITFGLDGKSYEIDLNAKNAASLRKALARFVAAARETGRSASTRGRTAAGSRGRRAGGKATTRSDLAEIRAWAKAAGYQ